MALINCPACGKRISDVTSMCPHCGLHRGNVSEEQLREFSRRRLRNRIYRLKMTTYAVMTLFVLAFAWYWWESGEFQRPPTAGPLALLTLGALGYLAIRVFLFRAKREMKKYRD